MNIDTPEQLASALSQARADTILAQSITAEMNAEVAAIQAKFEHKIKAKTDNVKALSKAIQVYAVKHRKTLLPPKAKIAKINGHELGWRDNGGAIKPARGVTEAKIVTRLIKAGGVLRKYFVRETPTLNKQAMKDKWSAFGAKLQQLGLRFKHEEDFFIELDITRTPEA